MSRLITFMLYWSNNNIIVILINLRIIIIPLGILIITLLRILIITLLGILIITLLGILIITLLRILIITLLRILIITLLRISIATIWIWRRSLVITTISRHIIKNYLLNFWRIGNIFNGYLVIIISTENTYRTDIKQSLQNILRSINILNCRIRHIILTSKDNAWFDNDFWIC